MTCTVKLHLNSARENIVSVNKYPDPRHPFETMTLEVDGVALTLFLEPGRADALAEAFRVAMADNVDHVLFELEEQHRVA